MTVYGNKNFVSAKEKDVLYLAIGCLLLHTFLMLCKNFVHVSIKYYLTILLLAFQVLDYC